MVELTLPKGHLVGHFSVGDLIIDTGSPVSFHYGGAQTLQDGDRRFPFSRMIACPKEALDRLTGCDIAGILGLDILKQSGFTADLERGRLELCCRTEDMPADRAELGFSLYMGAYIVTDDVALAQGGRLRKAILDTGAPVPYLSGRRSGALEETGERYHDLSPSFGELSGCFRRGELILPAGTGQRGRSVKFGQMPALLDNFGIFDAILGVSALTDRQIAFDFVNGRVYLAL